MLQVLYDPSIKFKKPSPEQKAKIDGYLNMILKKLNFFKTFITSLFMYCI